jgi:hypothetical protein
MDCAAADAAMLNAAQMTQRRVTGLTKMERLGKTRHGLHDPRGEGERMGHE